VQEWVWSSKPYPLGLTLKQIQDILRMDQPMDKHNFNMVVHVVACGKIQLLIEPHVHNMDWFCVSYYTHMVIVTAMVLNFISYISVSDARWYMTSSWHTKPNINKLATLLHSWSKIDNNISSCKVPCPFLPWFMYFSGHHLQIYLPHALVGDFILFTIDKHERRVSILDPFSELLSK
jgi:hypothetical protein